MSDPFFVQKRDQFSFEIRKKTMNDVLEKRRFLFLNDNIEPQNDINKQNELYSLAINFMQTFSNLHSHPFETQLSLINDLGEKVKGKTLILNSNFFEIQNIHLPILDVLKVGKIEDKANVLEILNVIFEQDLLNNHFVSNFIGNGLFSIFSYIMDSKPDDNVIRLVRIFFI